MRVLILFNVALVLVLLFSDMSRVNAQSVFKCKVNGVTTFSQTPCDDQYQEIEVDVSSATPESQFKLDKLQAQCLDVIVERHPYIDVKSARITSNKVTWLNDRSGARQVMTLTVVDSKSFAEKDGSFTGPKSYQCFLNHDGTKPSRIQNLVY